MLQEIRKRKKSYHKQYLKEGILRFFSKSAGSQVNHERQKGNYFVCILFQS